MARRDIISAAKKEILVEYYAVGRDSMTAAGMSLLIEKAREGVKVKIIIDAHANELPMGAVQEILKSSAKRLSVDDPNQVEQNMEVKLYNQSAGGLPNLDRIMHRDHAKLLVVDGEKVIMGGRNATSEYFGLNQVHNFIDMDVLLIGKTATEVKKNYMALWKSQLVGAPIGGEKVSKDDMIRDYCKPSPGMYKKNSDQEWLNCMNRMIHEVRDGKSNFFEIAKGDFSSGAAEPRDWAIGASEISDLYFMSHKANQFNSTNQKVSLLTDEYLQELSEAKHDIRLTTPYFLATSELYETLKAVRAKGVRVQVVTNSATSTDSNLFYSGYRTGIQKIIDLGVEIYELKGTDTLHAKTALIDDETLIIGSYNLDPRSAYINREVALIIHDKEQAGVASGLAHFMDEMKARAQATANEDESERRTGPVQYLIIKSLIFMDPLLKKVL